MPLAVNEVMTVVTTLSKDENLRVTMTQAVRGGAIAGGGAVIGGLVGGPVGMAIGGSIGSIIGAATAKDFKPLVVVLQQLPQHKKQELSDRLNTIITGFEPQDALALLALIQGSATLKMQVLGLLKNFIEKEQGMTVQC